MYLNKALQKFSTAQPSSSVAKQNINVMTLSCFLVSLSSLCFATDEDGCAVENFSNTLFKYVYNLHEEIFCLFVDVDKDYSILPL
jgi:hypothetical protein